MLRFLIFFIICAASALSQSAGVKIHEETRTFPTYDEGDPDPNPQFDAFYGDIFPNYPYPIRRPINTTRAMAQWRVVVLENEYLYCRILPDLGGHLHGCTDRITGKEIFYANPAIRRSDVSLRGGFIATGIESSFPLAHSRVSGSPVDFAWSVHDGMGRVVVEDRDLTTGMQWRVEFILRPGSAVLEQRATVYNGSPTRRGYQWWVNAAVELDDPHLRVVYPTRWMLPHNTTEMTSWPIDSKGVDLSDVANYKDMMGLFAHLSREPWMALYKPESRSGLAHYADPNTVKGKKIWVWGSSDTHFHQILTENFNTYVEMQAGELETQPEFGFLLPGQTKTYDHYWIPFHDLGGVSRATRDVVLNLSRKGQTVTVEIDATHVVKGAILRLTDAGKPVFEGPVDLDPREKYAKDVEAGKLTIDLTSLAGAVLVHHVEGEMDAAPFQKNAKNPEPVPFNDNNSDEEEASLKRGAFNEQRDQWVWAWGDYERGLRRTPGSPRLMVAAGRAAVALNRYDDAIRLLQSIAAFSAEASYYYGVALARSPEHAADAAAALTSAAKDPSYERAARLQLAFLSAREPAVTGSAEAAKTIRGLATKPGAPSRLGALEVSLLRRSGKLEDAKARLRFWLPQDPANDMLRVEQTLLGAGEDPALWRHLAANPEKMLNVAEEYSNIGAYDDALNLLDRRYPTVPETEKEPGTALPQDNPLVVYFRGFCRAQLGQDPKADFATAATLSTLHVFPHRAIEFRILQAALAKNEKDSVAHDLLGDLYFNSFRTAEAIREWKAAITLNKNLPALHRNLGRAMAVYGNDRAGGIRVLQEGYKLTPNDSDIRDALNRLGVPTTAPRPPAPPTPAPAPVTAPVPVTKPASTPVTATAPATPPSLPTPVSTASKEARPPINSIEDPKGDVAGRALIHSVKEGLWAASLFNAKTFGKPKQPDTVRQAYIEVQLRRIMATAQQYGCERAKTDLENMGDIDDSLPFTYGSFGGFIKQSHFQYYIGVLENTCGEEKAAKKRWTKVSKTNESPDSADFVFPLLAAKRLGESDADQKITAALQLAKQTPASAAHPAVGYFVQGALLLASGKTEQANEMLDKALHSGDPFLEYLSLAILEDAAQK